MADDIVKVIADTRTDAASLQVVVNGDEDTQVTTRLGESYPTVKKAIKLMTQAGVGFTPFESKNLMTASSLANGTYAIVTNDTADNNGLYFKKSTGWQKVSYDVDARQKEYADAARDSAISTAENYTTNELGALDTININSGKSYPLTYFKRSETATDSQNQYFVDALLDAQVINAERDCYYKLSYLQNGEVITGVSKNYGIIVERINIETGDTIRLIDYADTEKQVKPDRIKGGVQNFVLQTYLNTYIKLTFDVDKLPPDGTAIIARVETNFGYNSIIDPATYIYEPTEIYQQISDVDEAATTKASDAKTQAVSIATDLAATDATTKSNSARNDAIDAAALDATSKANAAKSEAIDVANKRINSTDAALLSIRRFELYGSYNDVQPSYIYQLYDSYLDGIDDTSIELDKQDIYIDYNHANKSLAVIWRHTNDLLFKTIWQPNGANSLFNFKSISSAIGADPTNQAWTVIQTVDTDYIPPVSFLATTGAMTSTGVSTAGGNHTTSDGTKTANMTALFFYVDDNVLSADYQGVAKSVKCVWTNMIYAPNTVVEQRYTLKQEVLAEFTAGHVGVLCKYTALEPLNLIYEGGTQLVGDGWVDGASFYNGVIKGFQQRGGFLSSGTKTEAPNSWAVVLKSSTLGYMASYLDRNFGTGSSKVSTDGVMAATNTSGAWKFYNFTARNSAEQQQSLTANEVMTWRGGYAYAPLDITDLNSAFIAKVGGKKAIGYEALANQKGVIKLPSDMLGKDYQLLTTSPSGAYVSASTYQSNLSKEV